ncbi:MAG: copper resistance protein CopC/CopD [Actinobacteria bacterium]|nr:copper resistance protein CopC/CopD [Actinomycetota bacterium]
MKRLLVLGAFVVLAVPAAAYAHATLKSVFPGYMADLAQSPRDVELHFDQVVQFPAVEVFDTKGRHYELTTTAHGIDVVAGVKHLPAGDYTIRWHALSADGHVVSGVWTFGVRMKALPPTEAFGASGPTRTEDVVRWLYFVALALVIGSLGFRLLCLRGLAVPPRVEKRLYAIAAIGVVGVLELGILAFCLRCADVLQLPFGKFLYGDLSPISAATRFGKAFIVMTLAFAIVAALLYLAWLTDRTRLLVPAFLIAVGFAAGLSLSGHDAVDPGSSKWSELADWVHLTAASLWIGGLVSLAAGVWLVAPEFRRVAFARFSRMARVLIALVLAAGTYLSIVRLPRLHDLWTTGYGQTLLVKIALVAVVLAWGALHHFVIRPALDRASDGFLTRVGRSLAGESAVAVAVLLLAAILTNSKPPPRPAPTTTAAAAIGR